MVSSEVNPLTGSVIVHYVPDRIDGQAIMQVLRVQGHCGPEVTTPVLETSNAWALRPAGSHDTPEMAPPFPPISLATLGTFLGVAGVALGKVVVGKLVEKAVERSAMALIGAIL